MLLLLSNEDERCVQAAKNCKKFGPRCAAAIVCAELFKDQNRAVNCAHWAVETYRRIDPDRNDRWNNLRNWIAWAGMPTPGTLERWPIRPEFADTQEEAGMANVMLRLAMTDLFEGTTSEKLAASKIYEFFNDNIKKEALHEVLPRTKE